MSSILRLILPVKRRKALNLLFNATVYYAKHEKEKEKREARKKAMARHGQRKC